MLWFAATRSRAAVTGPRRAEARNAAGLPDGRGWRPRFESGDGAAALSQPARGAHKFRARRVLAPHRSRGTVGWTPVLSLKNPSPARLSAIVVECWRRAYRVQEAASSTFASIHRVGTPSNRVQQLLQPLSAANCNISNHARQERRAALLQPRVLDTTAAPAQRAAMRLLLLLAAASQALQPQRHNRPRTQLQVAVLPDMPHSVEIPIGDGAPLILETGKIGRQADAAVVAKRGGTTVYATLCVGDADAGGGDFLPMSIDYQERYSATGRTSGAYNKRDGRASDGEILTCRLIDRPLRPSVVDGFCGDVQVLAWVLSYDGEHEAQTLAVQACSAALQLSSVPTLTSVGCARCTISDETLTTSPSVTEASTASFDIIVGAGSDGSVLMVEAEGSFAPEKQALAALNEAVSEAQRIGHAIGEWASSLKKEESDGLKPYPAALESLIEDAFGDDIREQTKALRSGDMASSRRAYGDLCSSVDALALEKDYTRADSSRVLKKLSSRAMCALVRSEGSRSDGRDLRTVRPIDIDMAPLPTAHGSVVFTRGETQSLATCTLGDQSMQLRVDDALEPNTEKRFYLQYAFPPSSVGETGRTGAPGRREVGHGALAEKALRYALPDSKTFPYSMRVESLITESCGSSSMASVCGGCLALLDAGVPLTTSVAGVAMGVLLDDVEDPVVLTDILGIEDALGGMDFKVAGSRDGISAFQLDVKELGLKAATLEKALAQAREARLHVLDEMASRGVDEPQALSDSVPKTKTLQVEPAKIGKIIGKGGETIRGLIADDGA